jgi:hypothetical protein
MGWASGSELGKDIYDKVREFIPEENRQEVAEYIYDYVCDLDADDWDSTSQLEIDADVLAWCYECDEQFHLSELNENHLCKKCKEGNNE